MSELSRTILLALACLPLAWAQNEIASTNQTSAAAADDHVTLIEKVMGIVVPTDSGPLTQTKRFHLYLLSVGPIPTLGEAIGAGISQWQDNPKEWGQGWNAYAKRFGSNLAYNGVRQTITYGTSILFHEDNRYFASHRHGVWARTAYAIRRTVTAQHPDGREVFSVSSVAGVFGASAISTMWQPGSQKGVDQMAENAGVSFATTAAFNVLREFTPDVLRRLRK
jgi:hypothetical protein